MKHEYHEGPKAGENIVLCPIRAAGFAARLRQDEWLPTRTDDSSLLGRRFAFDLNTIAAE